MSKVGGVQVLPFLDVHIELSAFFFFFTKTLKFRNIT